MRRTGCKMKRLLATLLAASLILPHGAMTAWAEEAALSQLTAIEEAVASAEKETSDVVVNDIEEETEADSSEE